MKQGIQSLVVAGMLVPAVLFAQSSQMSSAEMDKLFKEGVAYYEAKDYGKAAEIFQKLANQGHAEAQLCLGGCYGDGTGVPQDLQKVVYWLQKAANQGHAEAQLFLGAYYAYGIDDVPQDVQKAKYWLQKAADQGSKGAREILERLSKE